VLTLLCIARAARLPSADAVDGALARIFQAPPEKDSRKGTTFANIDWATVDHRFGEEQVLRSSSAA
jgi:hypothetical protein